MRPSGATLTELFIAHSDGPKDFVPYILFILSVCFPSIRTLL